MMSVEELKNIQTVKVNGHTLEYVHGDQNIDKGMDSPTIILLSGLGIPLSSWDNCLAGAQGNFTADSFPSNGYKCGEIQRSTRLLYKVRPKVHQRLNIG